MLLSNKETLDLAALTTKSSFAIDSSRVTPQPNPWWDGADEGFRSIAVAFTEELDCFAVQLENGSLSEADLRTMSHQVRGAAGVFLADATAMAAALLEAEIEHSRDVALLAASINALAAAMRKDAKRMRAFLLIDRP